jgi:hypothetical protein
MGQMQPYIILPMPIAPRRIFWLAEALFVVAQDVPWDEQGQSDRRCGRPEQNDGGKSKCGIGS